MQTTHQFLVPDYYPQFHCKIGSCRHTCCIGWPISISLQDYYNLIGVDCSPELRRKLDASLKIIDHPTKECYAQICPGYDGTCGLLHKDGRCALHAELGPQSLSTVCRLYPRGIRPGINPECSCANSCEAVLESFLHRNEPISFSQLQLTEGLPANTQQQFHFIPEKYEQAVRLHFIRIIQNRKNSMPCRLMELGKVLKQFQEHLDNNAVGNAIESLLEQPTDLCLADSKVTDEHLHHGLDIVENMIEELEERSQSVHEYGVAALKWFRESDKPIERYHLAKQRFYSNFPDWEIFFEHIFVNHMFFEQFPFQDRPLDLNDEHIGLCAGYAFLRFLCFGYLADNYAEKKLIDVCAAAFRLVDHTAFDAYSAKILKKLGCVTADDLWDLIKL